MSTHPRRLLPLAGILLTVGCSGDQPVDPTGTETRKTLNTECLNTASFSRRSGSTIRYTVNGSPASAVDNAAGRWNSGVASGARPGRYPRFAQGSGDVSVTMHPYAPSTSVTGLASGNQIHLCDSANRNTYCYTAGTAQYGSIANVAMHEFSHIYGFGHAKTGSSPSCVSNPESVTGTYGLHAEEKERIWLHYDGLTASSLSPLSAPDVTLDVGQSVTAQSTVTLSDGGQATHPSEFSWTSSNANVAAVNPATGSVTGIASGTAIITARAVNSSLSTSLSFTVSQPRSVSLSGPSHITAKGTYTYTASISGFTGSPTYRWEQRYCDGFTEASCQPWYLIGTAGSSMSRVLAPDCVTDDRNYQIRVTVSDTPYGYASATKRTALCNLP